MADNCKGGKCSTFPGLFFYEVAEASEKVIARQLCVECVKEKLAEREGRTWKMKGMGSECPRCKSTAAPKPDRACRKVEYERDHDAE
jgi:ssDNA-binding Zn-finger/Zn-ribbon topoisomerase 1